MTIIIDFKHGKKSYDIIFYLFRMLDLPKTVRILDLTFGRGRFYRRVVRMYNTHITAVDVVKHEWEVKPEKFYMMDLREFFDKAINGKIKLDADIIVIDPPWSSEKRGRFPRSIGVSNMPYHINNVNSKSLIRHALRMQKYMNKPLIYRYKEPLEGSNIVVRHHVKIMGNEGIIYYGVLGANDIEKRLGLNRWQTTKGGRSIA